MGTVSVEGDRTGGMSMTVATQPAVTVKVRDADGRELDSLVDLWKVGEHRAAIRFHSRSGARSSRAKRNTDYIPAHGLVLGRLAALKATLTDAYLDSDRHHVRPREERRIGDIPLALAGRDGRELAARLRRQASHTLSDSPMHNGNSTRKVVLEFELPGLSAWSVSDLRSRIAGTELPSPPAPAERSGDGAASATEGAVLYRLHRHRERNKGLVRRKKADVRRATGRLACEACTFDFVEVYGDLGEGVAECHHRVPLGQLTEETVTRIEDLAIVCANCHRILHRKRARGMTVEQLRERLEQR
jgi:hypothetical protein